MLGDVFERRVSRVKGLVEDMNVFRVNLCKLSRLLHPSLEVLLEVGTANELCGFSKEEVSSERGSWTFGIVVLEFFNAVALTAGDHPQENRTMKTDLSTDDSDCLRLSFGQLADLDAIDWRIDSVESGRKGGGDGLWEAGKDDLILIIFSGFVGDGDGWTRLQAVASLVDVSLKRMW